MPNIDDLNSKKQFRKTRYRAWNLLDEDTNHNPASEIEAKPSSNRGQIEAKPGTELRPIRGQTEAGAEQNTPNQNENRGQIEAKPGTELRPHSRPIRGQIEAKPGTELRPPHAVSSLDGLQRNILLLVFDHCKRMRSKQTPPLAVEHIRESCTTTYHAARKAIQRLEIKGLLIRSEFKVGRAGWTKYEVPNAIYQELLQNETEAQLRPIRGQFEAKPGTELETELRPSALSSSSSLDLVNKLTNTGDSENSADLPSEWIAIDTSSLTAIRFGRPQIVQLLRLGTLTVEELQESINAFAFDLEVNGKTKEINGHALNYFMGILRKGPYAPPANYEPPEIRQRRLYLEAKERAQKTREELESRLQAVEFDEWASGLTAEERSRLVPPQEFAKLGSQGHNVQLKEYFCENIWPGRREKVLRGEI